MSRNDRRVATILAIIIIFIGLILGQRKTEFLKNLDESFLECKCGVPGFEKDVCVFGSDPFHND